MNSNKKQLQNSINKFQKSQLSQTSQLPSISQNPPFNKINNHGFSNHLTLYQIIPILYFLLMTLQIIAVIIIIPKKKLKIVYGLAYTILFITVTILWYITTKIDPTDSIQVLYRKSIQNKKQMKTSYFRFFCHICKTCVSKSAFHCRSCNRCVDCFDHHCKWLNNCIGAKNYLQFFILIITTQIMVILHSIINIIDIIKTIKQQNQNNSFQWIFYLQIIFVTINVIILVFNTILVSIHIYLIIKKKSTMEFIMEKRKISKIHPIQQHNINHNLNKDSLFSKNQKPSHNSFKKQITTQTLKITNTSSALRKKTADLHELPNAL